MRFYALLAAFAALLIIDTEAEQAIDAVDKILTETQKSLKDYKYHLKNFQRYFENNREERKMNATATVEANAQELEKIFEAAQMQMKELQQCRNSFNTSSNRALTKHLERLNECCDNNLPNFGASVRRTAEMMAKGEIYRMQLTNIDRGCNETVFQSCIVRRAAELHTSVLIWMNRMKRMKQSDDRAISEARRQLPSCFKSSFNRFKRELIAGNERMKYCITGRPIRKSG